MAVTIIAEAGVNHNGSLEEAKKMARVAKECGADIVKYQTAVPELVVSRFAPKAEYQKQTTDAAERINGGLSNQTLARPRCFLPLSTPRSPPAVPANIPALFPASAPPMPVPKP